MGALKVAAPLQQGRDTRSILNETWLAPRELAGLASLGVQSDGWRIHGVRGSHDNRWFSYLELEATNPYGEHVVRPMRFMRNTARGGRGCVVVVMVNDHLATVRQYRLPVMIARGLAAGFTTELPRTFANEDLVTTMLERKLRRACNGKDQDLDAALKTEARNLLGSELGQLLIQPGVSVEELVSLGNLSEWEFSTHLTEVVLVRLACTNVEELKKLDLGPSQMKIRLYPFDQLLVGAERQRINFCDQASVSALALSWGYLQQRGIQPQDPTAWMRYTWDDPDGRSLLVDPAHRRILQTVNHRLAAFGQRTLDGLGASAPGAEILSLEPCPWLSSDGWNVRCFNHRLPNGKEGPYFVRMDGSHTSQEALVPIINETTLLTVRAHHLPFLMDPNPRRAWCNRTPTLKSDPTLRPNSTSRRFGESEACLSYLSPGAKLTAEFFRRVESVDSRIVGDLHEDSGANAVSRSQRLAQVGLHRYEEALDELNARSERRAKLVAVPIRAALLDPETHGVRDQQSLSALLVAAEQVGALFPRILP